MSTPLHLPHTSAISLSVCLSLFNQSTRQLSLQGTVNYWCQGREQKAGVTAAGRTEGGRVKWAKEETEHFPWLACADVHGQMEKCEERKMRIAQDKRDRERFQVWWAWPDLSSFFPTPWYEESCWEAPPPIVMGLLSIKPELSLQKPVSIFNNIFINI